MNDRMIDNSPDEPNGFKHARDSAYERGREEATEEGNKWLEARGRYPDSAVLQQDYCDGWDTELQTRGDSA